MEKQPSKRISFLFLLVFGGIFLSIGIVILMVSTNIFVVPEEKIIVPRWVLAAVGSTFSLAGVITLINGLNEMLVVESLVLKWLSNFMSFVFTISLAIPFHWVAFGTGDREFSGSVEIGPVAFSRQSGALGGRIAFGFFAILMDIFIILLFDRMVFGNSEHD